MTTRSSELAGEHRVAVASLEEQEGLRVLAGYMGRAAEELRGEAAARWLVARCCGNPAQLRSVAALCKKKGVAPTLAYLEQCRQKMRHAKLPDAGEEYGTLFDALAGSLDHLEPELAERCAMLATFPEDTRVPWSVVGQLWRTEELETEEALTELEEWHLIDVDWEARTVSLIDLHLDYLRARAKNDLARWHAALLRGCGRRRLGFDEDREDDSYWGNPIKVLHHLKGSGEELAKQGGCEQVQELCLRDAGDVEAQQLTEVLSGFTRLKTLDLGIEQPVSSNQLGAAGASAIASVLKTMQISILECVAQPRTLPQWLLVEVRRHIPECSLSCQRPLTHGCSHTILAPPLTRSLCLNNIGVEGASALAAILKETMISDLKCAATVIVCSLCVSAH